MSDLLDKYRSSRRAGADISARASSPSRSSLYPRLSSLDREKYSSDRYNNTPSTTSRLRYPQSAERAPSESSFTSKYKLYSDAVKESESSISDRLKPDSSFTARSKSNGLDEYRSESKRYTRNYELDGLKKNLEAKYGLGSTRDETDRNSRLFGSPANSRRSRNELGGRSSNVSHTARDKYRITKPSIESPRSGGFLSRIFTYFTSNEHTDDNDTSHPSSFFEKPRVKKVSFSDSIKREDDFDEVDDVVTRAREKERTLVLENYRNLEQEHKKVLLLLEEIELENKELKSELSKVHDTYTAKLDEIENDLFDKNVVADQLRINSDRKHTEEINSLKSAQEQEISRLQKSHERELAQLKSVHEEETRLQKDENSKLQKKIRELDEKLFDTGFELKQVKRDLDIQVRKNHEMQVEMSLRDRFRAAKLPADEVNEYFIKSSRIEQKIEALRRVAETPSSSKPQQFTKTETNIEENLKTLEKMTKSFQFTELDDCEKYYESAHRFLSDSSNKAEEIISQLEQDDQSSSSQILTQYLTLKRLNELGYKLSSVKELINDCKVLKEFKDSDVDVNDIYLRVRSELF
ncbi:hypothetical protein KGF57_004632 [Candida theae]|uniref:Uncharacterized protein n=1 Tax=Candida theae TaxID=1198502 RepID=A0AAD5BBH5_9ASCO|nr:uncharacterized protein KGF57_004632 [Candida theae]KAI5949809.1 hypothetical protein KGF57_004632 [Candida theae]